MKPIDRREFLGAAAGAAALGAAAVALEPQRQDVGGSSAAEELVPAPPKVVLGATGITMTRLGLGTGVHGSNRQSDQTRLGFVKLVELMRHAYDRGIRFFDLADMYGTHIYFREALKQMDRSKLAILTKMWWRYDGPETQTSLPERRQMARTSVERYRHELATDRLDVVLLHCLMKGDWDRQMGPYMEVVNDEKAKGRIGAVGCSCHSIEAMRTAAASPWVDVMLARINMRGGAEAKMDGTREEIEAVLREARRNGKAILGMKIFGEGSLADKREACIEYAQGSGLLDAMTIGFHEPNQIDDVLRLLAKYPARALV
ncbi:MAG: aldo/keto reductase [Pirellulales bacterium]|nr:aldo/keto reductase [Pirellulales bacterium]